MSPEEQPQEQQRSLYRRHRPRTFADVVGQEPVVRTLRNAVERGKVHHAYLFVGSRGTGKTSMAKILAACLNCENGPTIEPCGSCESCVSIASATSLDVIEMDAASNNSVDDIRELRESVAYAPVSGRRKIYILDEAHMLSTAAWNAFLKTLEEPPPNTIFVLATTEANKVPATVVDRCHRFDFHRPTVEQIASVVRRTADADGIEIPAPAVAALARSATGSFRDALGTLEQLVTYSGSQIALEDVLAVLGVADARLLEATVAAVAAGDAAGALRALEECVEQGRDAGSFTADLEVRARELLVVQTLGEVPAELSLTPEADAALAAQAELVPHAVVVRLLELLGDAMEGVRAGADPRTRLELALVKAAKPVLDGSARGLLARIERLEGGAPAAANPGARPITIPQAASPPSESASSPAPVSAQSSESASSPASASAQSSASAPASPPVPAPSSASAPAPAAPEPVAQRPAAESAGPADETPLSAPAVPTPSDGAPLSDTMPADLAPPAGPLPGAAVSDLAAMLSCWPAVVEIVRGENSLLWALIAEATPVAVDGDGVTLGFPASAQFSKRKAEDPANRRAVTEALKAITTQRWQLSYEVREELQAGAQPQPSASSEEQLVRRFIAEFDAEELSVGDLERGVGAVTSNEKGA